MKKFDVLVTETKQILYEVDAKNEKSAISKAKKEYYDEQEKSGIDDSVRVDFEVENDDNESEKVKESFVITVDYSKEDKNVFIATESSSGVTYPCETLTELKDAVSRYFDIYTETEINKNIEEKEEEMEK